MTYYDDYHYTLRKNIIMRISYIKVFPNKHRHLILLPRKLWYQNMKSGSFEKKLALK